MARQLKYANADHTMIVATEDGGHTYIIPVNPDNKDYAQIVLNGETVVDWEDEFITQKVMTERDRRIDAGFLYKFVLYQSRSSDRENIAGAAQLALMAIMAGAQPGNLRWNGDTEDFTWIAADNSLVPMDAQTVLDFAKVCAEQKSHLIKTARDIKNRITNGEKVDFYSDATWS